MRVLLLTLAALMLALLLALTLTACGPSRKNYHLIQQDTYTITITNVGTTIQTVTVSVSGGTGWHSVPPGGTTTVPCGDKEPDEIIVETTKGKKRTLKKDCDYSDRDKHARLDVD